MKILEVSLWWHPDDSGIRVAREHDDDELLEVPCDCGHFIQFWFSDDATEHDCEWCEQVRLVLVD